MATSILSLSELRPSLLLRQLASECIGTLLLVIVGCGRSLPLFSLLAIDIYIYPDMKFQSHQKCSFTSTTCLKSTFSLECHLNYISSHIFSAWNLFLPQMWPHSCIEGHYRWVLHFFWGFRFYFSKAFTFSWAFHAYFHPQIWRHSCMGGDDQDGKNQLGDQVGTFPVIF